MKAHQLHNGGTSKQATLVAPMGQDVEGHMKRVSKLLGMGTVLLLGLAAGCGQAAEERVSAAELAGSRPGQMALVPVVELDGLDALSQRSAGDVVVQDVIMNAQGVRLWDDQGASRDLQGASRFFLRYSPMDGENGLSRLWAPAEAQFTTLTLDVAPLHLSPETLQAEAAARNLDLDDLSGSSVVIRGVIATGSHTVPEGTVDAPLAGTGCDANSLLCRATIPDTAPGAPSPVEIAVAESKEAVGTIPDTAPGHARAPAPPRPAPVAAAANTRTVTEYRPFVLVADATFMLSAALDPVVAQGGGVVRLHLDVDELFSDARVEELQLAARRTPAEARVVKHVQLGDISHAIHVHAGEVATLMGPKPR